MDPQYAIYNCGKPGILYLVSNIWRNLLSEFNSITYVWTCDISLKIISLVTQTWPVMEFCDNSKSSLPHYLTSHHNAILLHTNVKFKKVITINIEYCKLFPTESKNLHSNWELSQKFAHWCGIIERIRPKVFCVLFNITKALDQNFSFEKTKQGNPCKMFPVNIVHTTALFSKCCV